MVAKSKAFRRVPVWWAACFLFLFADAVSAGEADVLKVRAEHAPDGTYTFHVTVGHADSGWDHYANAWTVTSLDGKLLGERILFHPHVEEQPFTRSLSGIVIPEGTTRVIVKARDSRHGEGGRSVEIALP